MNQYGCSTCVEVAKLYESAFARNLNQQTWSEQYKEHHCHKHRPPIRHLLHLLSLSHSLYQISFVISLKIKSLLSSKKID